MEAVYNQNVFPGPTFSSASQYPPAPGSRNRIDHTILYLDSGTTSILCLNLSESKRASTRSHFSLAALERQALDYCTEYLQSEPSVPYIYAYATTSAGAHARVWKVMQGSRDLVPFWGPSKSGNWAEYKDLGDNEQAALVEEAFRSMKAYPPTPLFWADSGVWVELVWGALLPRLKLRPII